MIFVLKCVLFLLSSLLLLCYISPLLTWRDVQHIIVKTSRAGHLSAPDWKTNAAGYNGMRARPAPWYFYPQFNCLVWDIFVLDLCLSNTLPHSLKKYVQDIKRIQKVDYDNLN